MDLLLWRHAEAEEGEDDLARRLTEHGRKQAKVVAKWLRGHRPQALRVIVSPAVRAQQTAEALKLSSETVASVGPAASAEDIVAASGWPHASEAVLIVGHQPNLGQAAALLLAGREDDWTIAKGALWWFSSRTRDGASQTILRAVISAELFD